MHNRIEISRGALAHNLKVVRDIVGECCLIAPVVKGNAYGHGLVPVSKTLIESGANGLCVFSVNEGVTLRQVGVDVPILVLGYVSNHDYEAVIEHDLRIFIDSIDVAKDLNSAGLKARKVVPVHLKIDTGLGRFGVFYDAAEAFVQSLKPLQNLRVEGIASHFATSDAQGENEHCHTQFKRFLKVIDMVKAQGFTPSIRHISNTAALLRYPEMRLDMVRPGRILYGYLPTRDDIPLYAEQGIDVQQVISVKTVVALVKKVPSGTPISYGLLYVTSRDTTIAVLPFGYADGLSRFLSNKGSVLIKGKRAPIIGRVGMNSVTVDITDIPGVLRGDEAVLLGKQGDDMITCYEMADMLMNTLPYNVLTAFQDSLPRILTD